MGKGPGCGKRERVRGQFITHGEQLGGTNRWTLRHQGEPALNPTQAHK